ncbi:MAG: 50S ribosomal protein L9 [Pseudopedobacter sp.]|nr:50S ribosomal protein L9 [Deinococcales bacterium]
MNIILLEPMPKLGKVGDVVSVKGGYARNFLVPRGIALYATASNMKTLEARIRSKGKQLEREKIAAEKLAESLAEVTVNLTAKAGEGKIFGAVTSADVVEALKAQTGHELDRRKFELAKPIKETGEYVLNYKAHHDVIVPIKIVITAA